MCYVLHTCEWVNTAVVVHVDCWKNETFLAVFLASSSGPYSPCHSIIVQLLFMLLPQSEGMFHIHTKEQKKYSFVCFSVYVDSELIGSKHSMNLSALKFSVYAQKHQKSGMQFTLWCSLHRLLNSYKFWFKGPLNKSVLYYIVSCSTDLHFLTMKPWFYCKVIMFIFLIFVVIVRMILTMYSETVKLATHVTASVIVGFTYIELA
jgi:hypothetical protein